jgi:RHS repeat-associated protein
MQDEIACADCDPSGGGGGGASFPTDPYFGTSRTRPENETGDPGVTLGSRNFNWSMPLVSLPGRAGMDLSISLFYNSLVWTRQGSAIQYNADHGTPAPGFQLGLPRLQAQYFNTDDNSYAYMVVTPSGGRVEMKQVGATNVFESADSTYTQLGFSGSTPIVRTTDGTQFIFGMEVGAEWRCTMIRDRNGNYISATYDSTTGHILTVTDTLGRVLNFNYNTDNNLHTITQMWGASPHTLVTFVYTTVDMSFNFPSLNVFGATSGGSQTVLDFIAFPENTSYHFDYNSYGQVYQIRHKAPDDHELEHTRYNNDAPSGAQTDCPRFTERRDYAQDWNGGAEAVTTYSVTTGATWTNPESGATETGTLVQQTLPDTLTVYKEYSHASGWDVGLARLTEIWFDGVKKKWTSTDWTQDNTTLSYSQNPRVAEINVYDDGSNRRRTNIAYNQGYGLPTAVFEYSGSNGQTLLRSSAMSYVSDSAYLDRRIIGLPLEQIVYDASSNIVAKQDYQYDWGDSFFSTQQPAINFDATNYPSSFRIGRGNLSAVRRFDCTNSTTAANSSLAIYTQRVGHNAAGLPVSTLDADGHTTTIGYGDNFSDSSKNQGTLAYATTVTDPAGYSSTAQYNYDFGAITLTHVPTSGLAPNITYLDVLREYDDFGRLETITNQTNNANTRFVYEANANYVHTYQTIIDLTTANEFHSWQIFDGAGRVRASASDHPGSTSGSTGQYVIYNSMGRVVEQSNPTEINSSWAPGGDDAAAGWRVILQSYDWKGRPKQTTNSDGTTRVLVYGGCGCAGGEVITAQDEKGRQKRFSKDTLGRLATVEEMVWNTGTVYATTLYSYNARDQITDINQSGQHRTFTYDGHGRLSLRYTPEQGWTTYGYNPDDTTQMLTDARNVTTTYGYNNRHQITSLTYNVTGDPTGQTTATANASFEYDAAGNRTSMNDGLGSASYNFNNLGQMASETRSFNGLTGSYGLNYEYNLAGQLKKVTNHWGAEVSYGYDKAGRLLNVNGAGYAGVTNYASSLSYRAFGAIKGMNYGDGRALSTAYDNRMRPTTWNVPGVMGWSYAYNNFGENTGRVTFAQSLNDATLDRSYHYDQVGRLDDVHTGAEARAALQDQGATPDGPYSHHYWYDPFGNMGFRVGWGGSFGGYLEQSLSFTNNRLNTNPFSGIPMQYDGAGNLTNDGNQSYSYDATGQQTYASGLGAGGSAPAFTDDPLKNPENPESFKIKLIHLTQLREAVNGLRVRAGLPPITNWNPDANPEQNVTMVKAEHIRQLRTKLEEALNALHLPVGSYEHLTLTENSSPIYAVDFQELRQKIKDAWTALASTSSLTQAYDGDGLRVKKTEYGWSTLYLRSSVLGGQVISEVGVSASGGTAAWQRGYVYAGSSLMAVQQGGVFWMHEDPVTKSKRVTDSGGNIVSTIDLDPWGGETNRSGNQAFQPQRYTSHTRDSNGGDDAMFRRYQSNWTRFAQPDPYERSYDLGDPQSFNRYAYVQNDPVNFVDPLGLMRAICQWSVFEGGIVGGECFGGDRWGGYEPKPGPGGGEPQKPYPPPIPQPAPTPPKPPGLSDCIKNYLAKFFDRSMLDAITWGQGIPWYVPGGNDNGAFTLDDHIYFGTGAFNPSDGIQLREIILIGHETAHVRQYRQNGSLRMKAKYLANSAIMGAAGSYVGVSFDIASYYGNRFEQEAFKMEKKIRDDLAKNGNPCP